MRTYFKKMERKCFGTEKNICGVMLRGTDYVEKKPVGHAIQPAIEDVISKVKEEQKRLGFTKIYLATEDDRIYAKFREVFGDTLIEYTQYRYKSSNGEFLSRVKVDRKNHYYLVQKEYAASMYLLSKCKYFISSLCTGTMAVYFMSNCFKDFDYFYVWNLGTYTKEDQDSALKKS